MNIVHIMRIDAPGGAEDFALEMADYFQAPIIVSNKLSEKKNIHLIYEGRIDKIRKSLFSFFDKVLWKLGYHQTFKNAFFLHDTLNNTFNRLKKMEVYNQADIIHLHNIHGSFFDIRAIQKIAKHKKIVWTLHDMWMVTGGEAHTFENKNYKTGNPNTPYTNIYPLSEPYLIDLRGWYILLKKRVYKKAAKNLNIIPISNWLENVVKSSYVYNPEINFVTIRHGIDTGIFNNRKKRNWSKPRILIHNSNNPFKGSEIYPDVLNNVGSAADLYVIGNSIKINSPHINIIQLDYFNSKEELADVFNEVDIMIHPSNAESLSLMILQAMGCGVCVFGSSVGGIPELLSDSRGVLFNRDDLNNLSIELNDKLINIETARSIGGSAANWVSKNATFKKMADSYEQLYKKVLKVD